MIITILHCHIGSKAIIDQVKIFDNSKQKKIQYLMACFPGQPGKDSIRKVKPFCIFNEASDDGVLGWHWQWHRPDHMQSNPALHPKQVTMPTPHHSISTGQIPFVSPNQQCKSTEYNSSEGNDITNKSRL